MNIDLQTLWYLTIGTLLVSTAGLLWQRKAFPARADVLGILAWSLAFFALGCLVAMNRTRFPGAFGPALSNLLIVTGYLLALHAAARLDGRSTVRWSAVAIAALGLSWWAFGARFPAAFWNHVAALPIALTCGLTGWTLLRSHTARDLRSRPVAAAISAIHALFYAGRTFVAPILGHYYGVEAIVAVGKATMYEAVLYSVAMPMSFLAIVWEEEQRRLVRLSQTDHLTGLTNRHGFFDQGERLLAARRPSEPASLLAFDLDHFKTINDRFGHATGDEVLKLFAAIVREEAGPDTLIVRLGGEEFAVLLVGHGRQEALDLGTATARRFRAATALIEGPRVEATVSVGLAETSAGGGDLAGLLHRADRALYRAKSLGRNRVEVAERENAALAA